MNPRQLFLRRLWQDTNANEWKWRFCGWHCYPRLPILTIRKSTNWNSKWCSTVTRRSLKGSNAILIVIHKHIKMSFYSVSSSDEHWVRFNIISSKYIAFISGPTQHWSSETDWKDKENSFYYHEQQCDSWFMWFFSVRFPFLGAIAIATIPQMLWKTIKTYEVLLPSYAVRV